MGLRVVFNSCLEQIDFGQFFIFNSLEVHFNIVSHFNAFINKVTSCKSIKVFYLLSCPLNKSLKDKGDLMSGPVYIKYVHNLGFMVFAV